MASLADKSDSFNSEHWIPTLRKLADDFYEHVKTTEGGNFVSFNPVAFDTLKVEYNKRYNELKDFLYGEERQLNKIDQHKIISLYIELLLELKPFVFTPPLLYEKNVTCLFAKLSNEFFCFSVITTIIMGWNERKELPELPYKYKIYFIVLMYFISNKTLMCSALAFSHIMFFIESYYLNTLKL